VACHPGAQVEGNFVLIVPLQGSTKSPRAGVDI
jgi:hypothetical protein